MHRRAFSADGNDPSPVGVRGTPRQSLVTFFCKKVTLRSYAVFDREAVGFAKQTSDPKNQEEVCKAIKNFDRQKHPGCTASGVLL